MKGDEVIACCPERGTILLRNVNYDILDSQLYVRCPSCSSHFHRARELKIKEGY